MLKNAFQRFTDAVDSVKQKASSTYGALDKHAFSGYLPGGASREAGYSTPQIPVSVGNVIQKGAIPVVPVHTSLEGPAKFLKSMAGDLGKPFHVHPALTGRKAKFDKEINAGTYDKDSGTITYGDKEPGYKKPKGLVEQLERGIYGQWQGNVDKTTGAVTITETPTSQAYDTNGDAEYFQKMWDKGGIENRLEAGLYGTYEKLQRRGLTNKAPQGSAPQLIGYVNPETGQAIDGPFNADFENVISEPQSRPTPPAASPAMQAYEVAVGDTLTAIAAKHGLSIDEIARKNNITNVDNIGVGQQLKL